MHSNLKRTHVQCSAESGKLECVHLLHVYGMYKGGTSDLRKKGRIPGADLEGGGVFQKGGSGPPPPLELSKYTSQRTSYTTFQGFWRYQGVTLYAYLKCFGSLCSPVITSTSNESTCTMIRHYRSTILQIDLEIPWLCIVHILSSPVQNNYFF